MGLGYLTVTYDAWTAFRTFKAGAVITYYITSDYTYLAFVYDKTTNTVFATELRRVETNAHTTAFEGGIKGSATAVVSIGDGVIGQLSV